MIEMIPLTFAALWLLAGLIALLIGNFIKWHGGGDIKLGEFTSSAVACAVLGGIALLAVSAYLVSVLFNAHKVLLRGRGRCVECDGLGYHKMSCSQRYKDLGNA